MGELIGLALAAAAMTAATLAYLAWSLVRRAARAVPPGWQAANRTLLRQALCRLDLERASGELDADGHRAATQDLLREVLVDEAGDGTKAAASRRSPLLVLSLAVPLFAASLYWACGNPEAVAGNHDVSVSASAINPANLLAMMARLESHLSRTPQDGRAWVMLARLRMDNHRYMEAAQAYGAAMKASGLIARDPQLWCEWADALGMAQNGTLAGRPRELIAHALSLNAAHPRALEMAGSAAYEAGDHAAALNYWEQLSRQLAPGSEAHRELQSALEGVRLAASRALPSPGPRSR